MKRHERLPLLLAACLAVSAAACNVATSTDEAASAADEISDVVATDLGEVRGTSADVDGTIVRIFVWHPFYRG